MPSPSEIHPEDCPEPFWHNTHRYCPVCSWTEAPTIEIPGRAPDYATTLRQAVAEEACRVIEVDGEPAFVLGSGKWTERDREMFAQIARAARAKAAAEASQDVPS